MRHVTAPPCPTEPPETQATAAPVPTPAGWLSSCSERLCRLLAVLVCCPRLSSAGCSVDAVDTVMGVLQCLLPCPGPGRSASGDTL